MKVNGYCPQRPKHSKSSQYSKFLKLYPQSETQKSNPTFGENVGNMRQYKGTKYGS